MRRREFLKYSAATAAAAPSVRAARADSGVVNVGIVNQKLAPSHPARHSRVSALRLWPTRSTHAVASSSKLDRRR